MRSITGCGIWLEAALSRNTSGFPFTSRSRIGKSARTRFTSSASLEFNAALSIAVIVSVLSSRRRAGLGHDRALEPPHDRAHRNALDHGRTECVSEKVSRGTFG